MLLVCPPKRTRLPLTVIGGRLPPFELPLLELLDDELELLLLLLEEELELLDELELDPLFIFWAPQAARIKIDISA